MQFTAQIELGESGFYVGQINEIPAALSQGKTPEDLKENLLDALNLLLNTDQIVYPIKFIYQKSTT